MVNATKWLLTVGTVLGCNGCVWAQSTDVPKAEYLSHCAGCHGDGAKGDGPLGVKLTTRPADLTVLSRKNKGVFPVSAVYAAIDGRNVEATEHLTCRYGGVDRRRLFRRAKVRKWTSPTHTRRTWTLPATPRTSSQIVFYPLSNICGEFRSRSRGGACIDYLDQIELATMRHQHMQTQDGAIGIASAIRAVSIDELATEICRLTGYTKRDIEQQPVDFAS
jgi:mono/diheme cytochrome c family protein